MKQHITRLVDDEGAVSPVIGVILMVAITVILAAVIGTFVLGLGGQVSQTAPQASISTQGVSASDDTITFKHGGSDTIKTADTSVKVSVNGTSEITFDSEDVTNELDFTTADTAVVYTNVSNVTISGTEAWSESSTVDLQSGADWTVTWVDQPSGQVIAEKSGTV